MDKIFIKNTKKKTPSLPLKYLMSKDDVNGEIGLEIEVEGKNLPIYNSSLNRIGWRYTKDGSLRGEENGEYVFNGPCSFAEAEVRIDNLWSKFAAAETQFDDSNRTSVHVHLNCLDFSINRLTSFAALYFCFEEILTAYAGDHRVGNLFCLRAVDAPGIIKQFQRFVEHDGLSELSSDLHYSGWNIHSLKKFGSVEIRTLRGVYDRDVIKLWIKLLQRLYELSAKYEDPREILGLFSASGPVQFFYNVFGDLAQPLRLGCGMTETEFQDSLYTGLRLIQPVCYVKDWDLYKPVVLEVDPFGRAAVFYADGSVVEEDMLKPYYTAQGATLGAFVPFQPGESPEGEEYSDDYEDEEYSDDYEEEELD